MNKIKCAILIGAIILIAGCLQEETGTTTTTTTSTTSTSTSTSTTTQEPYKIKIASWHINDLDPKKANDSDRMLEISYILRDHDLIAIQGIKNLYEKSDQKCPLNNDSCPTHEHCDFIKDALYHQLNVRRNLDYEYVFSPQVNDERYLYVYNPEKIQLVSHSLVQDPEESKPICGKQENHGLMKRQPFKASFRANTFNFTLLNVHTDPKNNIEELQALEEYFRKTEKQKQNVILLGNLYADCGHLLGEENLRLKNSRYEWIIEDDMDTTVAGSNCAYDRIIVTEAAKHYTGVKGRYFDISEDISEHHLVYAQFSTD